MLFSNVSIVPKVRAGTPLNDIKVVASRQKTE
jgi:hypothetical protein